MPGYATLDLGVAWPLSRYLELQLLGRNVLNRAHLELSIAMSLSNHSSGSNQRLGNGNGLGLGLTWEQ